MDQRLQPSSQEPLTPGIPAWEQCQPNSNMLPVTREMEQYPSELTAPRRIGKPPQSILVAKGDRCSSKFGIFETSIGAQTSQPALVHNLPPYHTDVRCLGTVRNEKASAVCGSSDPGPIQSHTQDSDLPGVPQSPHQTSTQNIGAGKPWTSSLNNRHGQPAQQLSEWRSDDASKACQDQGTALIDPCKPRQSSADKTSTNSFSPATGLTLQRLPEQNTHTSLPVSTSPHSSTTSTVAGTWHPQVRHLHALPPQCGLPSPYHPPFRPDKNDIATPQARPAQVSHGYTGRRSQSIKDLSFPSPHNSMWVSVGTGILKTSRTANDKKRLRDRAAELVR